MFSIPPLLRFLGIDFAVQLGMGCLAILFRTEKFFDLTGSLTFLTLTLHSLFTLDDQSFRQILISVLVVLWAFRLGFFLFIRIIKDGKDKRFDKIRGNPVRFLTVWLVQGVWVFLTLLPVLLLNTTVVDVPLGVLDYFGMGLWVVGFFFEVVADFQKFLFRMNTKNHDKFIQHGLWKYSQHPNYFGEITLWTGIYLSSVSVFSGFQHLAFISPLFVYFLLTRVSGIPLLKKANQEKFGKVDSYQDYVRRTNLLVPGIPK
eukprot:TRINITY_DN8715_c0_g1_i1.p1 TRINITY_DN8715_c0_g1~~TRINITY_DN8715_c0_g1_i1.p1  ORF type:complete len:259 (+),score=53.85 TRINITY_DN8715_c0_g1_i1:61-837(+)